MHKRKTWKEKLHGNKDLSKVNKKFNWGRRLLEFEKEITTIGVKLNNYINSIGKRKSQFYNYN